jgi:hypothetical protein
MAGRPGLDPSEEAKSYSAMFVLMVALLLGAAVWSIWDDNISRRPWKEYQVEFDRLAYNKYMKDAAAEQKLLDADPQYQKLTKELAQAKAELASGATTRKLEELRAQLKTTREVSDDKEQAARFTKSFLTERWYDYNHAIQEKQDPSRYMAEINQLDAQLAVEQKISDAYKAQV